MRLAPFDHKGSLAIHKAARRYEWLHVISVVFARWVLWLLLVLVGVMVFVRSEPIYVRGLVVGLAMTLLIGVIGNLVLGKAFVRKRPFVTHKLHPLIPTRWLQGSFPSDHSMLSFAIAVSLLIADPVTGIWAVIIAGCIALSRVAVGVHYLSDILVGALVGSGAAILAWLLLA